MQTHSPDHADYVALKARGLSHTRASLTIARKLARRGFHILRELGPDALQAVADGDADLTDPEYVAAAQQVADLGASGYFGEGVGSIDYDTSINQFLNGSSPMLYMGSWVLSNFADDTANQIGEDSIGYLPFPVSPYVGVGAGYIWSDIKNARFSRGGTTFRIDDQDDGQFAYQFIGGLAFKLFDVPGLAFTAEYRFLGTTDPTIRSMMWMRSRWTASGPCCGNTPSTSW